MSFFGDSVTNTEETTEAINVIASNHLAVLDDEDLDRFNEDKPIVFPGKIDRADFPPSI